MRPGVTNLPVPSITVAPGGAGAAVSLSTETILPSAKSSDARESSGPAAVRIVAFRIRTGGAAGRWYVETYCGCTADELSDAACIPAEAQPAVSTAPKRDR